LLILGSAFELNIHHRTKWSQNSFTIAGGNGKGNGLNQLNSPLGLCIDDDQIIYVADYQNDRIMEWKYGATTGKVVAGGNGRGNRMNQLDCPTDVIVDKKTGDLIICDCNNRRVVRWPRRNGTSGQAIISNIDCRRLAMDNTGYLYVSNWEKHEVRQWKVGDTNGTLVAGGNGKGNRLDQFNHPTFIFVDNDHSVYVSDGNNYRVMKWKEGAKEGIIVAGGHGEGNSLAQLSDSNGVIVDRLGTIYVADSGNNRIMRWCKGAIQGNIVVGENGSGERAANQLNFPSGLSFDRQGNLYVVDHYNHRIQRFNIARS
jgi:sugar lactone lactonase YvrE